MTENDKLSALFEHGWRYLTAKHQHVGKSWRVNRAISGMDLRPSLSKLKKELEKHL